MSLTRRARIFIALGATIKLAFIIYFTVDSGSYSENVWGFIALSWFEFGPFALLILQIRKQPSAVNIISTVAVIIVIGSFLLYLNTLVLQRDPSRVLIFPFVSLLQYGIMIVSWVLGRAVKST